jgi:hypothetical protein
LIRTYSSTIKNNVKQLRHCETPQEKLGRGEKVRERERNQKVDRFSPVWRESDPLENALNFNRRRESL